MSDPGPSSQKPFWEQQAEMESLEAPEFVPRDDEMEEDEDTSSGNEEMGTPMATPLPLMAAVKLLQTVVAHRRSLGRIGPRSWSTSKGPSSQA